MSAFTAARLAEDRTTKFFAAVLADRPAPAGQPRWVELRLTSAAPVITQLMATVARAFLWAPRPRRLAKTARRTCPGDSATAYSHEPHRQPDRKDDL